MKKQYPKVGKWYYWGYGVMGFKKKKEKKRVEMHGYFCNST